MPRLLKHLATTHFSFDTRSLAAFRVALATTLFADLWLRYRVLDAFYTNEGILPNHTLLWAPPSRYMFSIFFSASHHGDALAMMLLCGLAFALLLFGLFTKLAQILSLLAVISLDTRLAPLENGGDMVLSLLCIWSVFLPLGERFSLDALRASLRRRKEQSPAQLNDRAPIRTPARRAYSLACGALILQFFAIYLFNVLHKNGPTWLSGEAVHYALHQDRIVKWPGVWLRENASADVLRALTYVTIVCEALAAVLIINPFQRRYTNLLALALLPGMHVAFDSCIDVGVFSFAMIAFYPLLIEPSHWQWLTAKLARWHERRVVFVDADCGFCMMCARLLARLDVFQRLEFASNGDVERLPEGITLEMADESITTFEPERGRVLRGAPAMAALVRSLPLGFALAVPLQLPGLRNVAELVYARVARNRIHISIWLGYAACGLPLPAAGADAQEEPAQVAVQWARVRVITREACVVLYLLAATSDLLNGNAAVPEALKHQRPQLFDMLVQYPRAFQGWRMFAPHAPLEDFMIEVDAVTLDGRHVDPFNAVASRVPGPGYTEIPERLNQNQFFCGYALFGWQPSFAAYSTAFQEWILRYHERTGRPEDRIVQFKAYKLSDRSPPLGQTQPTDFKREQYMKYP